MKNFKLLLVAFLALLLAYGCEKEEKPYVPIERCANLTRNIDTIGNYIKGTWDWVEELRVSRNGVEYITPNSPGYYHIRLNFSGDTVKFIVENRLDSIYSFRIQRELEITGILSDSLTVLAYYSFYGGYLVSYVPVKICQNQLLMELQHVTSLSGEKLWIRK